MSENNHFSSEDFRFAENFSVSSIKLGIRCFLKLVQVRDRNNIFLVPKGIRIYLFLYVSWLLGLILCKLLL